MLKLKGLLWKVRNMWSKFKCLLLIIWLITKGRSSLGIWSREWKKFWSYKTRFLLTIAVNLNLLTLRNQWLPVNWQKVKWIEEVNLEVKNYCRKSKLRVKLVIKLSWIRVKHWSIEAKWWKKADALKKVGVNLIKVSNSMQNNF